MVAAVLVTCVVIGLAFGVLLGVGAWAFANVAAAQDDASDGW